VPQSLGKGNEIASLDGDLTRRAAEEFIFQW
jgi:hypothetical protein